MNSAPKKVRFYPWIVKGVQLSSYGIGILFQSHWQSRFDVASSVLIQISCCKVTELFFFSPFKFIAGLF